MTDPLVHEFTVDCSPEHAFSVWAERTSLWWPGSHSVSGAPESVDFEPRAGGRIVERAPGGEEHEWGRVLAWEPPRRLVYSWHLRQDAADATEVEITFAPAGSALRGDDRAPQAGSGWARSAVADLRERNVRGWAGAAALARR